MNKHSRAPFTLALLLMVVLGAPHAMAAEIDWSRIKTTSIKVFYPGVSSWEFLRGHDHGVGAAPVKTMKKACAECHVSKTGKYDIKADRIIAGILTKSNSRMPFEPQPLPGESGFRDVTIQAVYDTQNIYLRFQWPGPTTDPSTVAPNIPANWAFSSINVQLGNTIGSFRKYGCFITCHDDQAGMPADRGENTRLYAYYTRAKGRLKSQDMLDQYITKGQFLDLWRINIVLNLVTTEDLHILQDRSYDHNDLTAEGNYSDGVFSVVVTRKLSTGDAMDIKLGAGETFTIGIAIHDNLNRGRRHYTSFPLSVGLSVPADVTASRF